MGLVRLLLLALLVYVIWRLVKGTLAGRRRAGPGTREALPMLRCAQCGIHVPEQEVLHHDGQHFCCLEHKQLWLEKQRD